jgi:hypothetical protein
MSNRQAHPSSAVDENTQMVPLFATPNFAEAEVITDLFDAEDIAYIAHQAAPPQFMVSAGDPTETQIAVAETQAVAARALIQQAIDDDAIPGDGNFIETET